METESDIAIEEPNCPAADVASTRQSPSSKRLRTLGVISLVAWALAILYFLFGWRSRIIEITMFLSYSLTAFAGFYLACGNARWWVRWLLVSLAIQLITLANYNSSMLEGVTYFSVLAMISAGFTFAGRMVISAFRRESSPRQRFTIFGLMIVTAITAVCLVALNISLDSESGPSVLVIIAALIIIGFALTAQCASAWSHTKREGLVVGLTACLMGIPSSLSIHLLFHYIDRSPPEAGDVLIPVWTMVFFMWMLLYPLWFGFYALGWTLIDPGWKFGSGHATKPAAEVAEKEVDVLMED
ncbi:hypothetical protein C5Y96_06645 [Blastopirellula marina]|uniref:Uncharacterized protein n=1 Tax=Blastopirellula marina TaxID=124 RepID=A0A2S8FXE5_9BACT|nr:MULTISPECIES: hypothetical protein [Pirellulaceae]PQO36839.1 hypothetical protein C5Y96_06645 [Blastopirellula marina]RCS53554.1 hypothetical protein DTL36_06655 [Bremerella cremea]